MTDNFEKKVNKAMDICESDKSCKNFEQIYSFTTENIFGYMSYFDLFDKSLLTVGSSGDQAFNAVLQGCKDITIFDVCPFVKEYYYLKRSALETFSREEFLKFFCYKRFFINNKKAFNKDMYLSLRNRLKDNDYESYMFWDKLFQEYSGLDIRTKLFIDEEQSKSILCHVNTYLRNDCYYDELRKIINDVNIDFQQGNIFEDNLLNSYDNIFLSNICSYYSNEQMIELFNRLLPYLNDDGNLMIGYLYYGYELFARVSELVNMLKNLPEDFKYSRFVGVSAVGQCITTVEDTAVIYKKVLKKG